MRRALSSIIALSSLTMFNVALAQDGYLGGSVGLALQSDSNNTGQTGAFTTGNLGDGTTLDVASGTPYGWDTEFESGLALSAEIGVRYPNNWRIGMELAYTGGDIDTHNGVTLGGGSIDAVDAAAIASSPDPLGVTVATVVADGQGDISSTGLFANGYYDFNPESAFRPYIGAGLGLAKVDVSYKPSGIDVIDESKTKLAYQLKLGATFSAQTKREYFGEYVYRATEDIDADNVLFPGTLDIENRMNVFTIGVRQKF